MDTAGFLYWNAIVEGDDVPDLAEILNRPAWMNDGACREHPEVNFFNVRGENAAPAKRVCCTCLVRSECLAFALSMSAREDCGVWGGMSERERKRLRRELPRPPVTRRIPRAHCGAGHALDGDNLYVTPAGVRVCRACRVEAQRRHRAKQAS